jgi:hypothetical protein
MESQQDLIDLRDPEDYLAAAATPEMVPAMRGYLKHENENVRAGMAEVLARIKALEALPDLLSVLENDNEEVRWRVAEALVNIGTHEALTAVVKTRRTPWVKPSAVRAMTRLIEQGEEHDLASMVGDSWGVASMLAAAALCRFGRGDVAPAMIRGLEARKLGPQYFNHLNGIRRNGDWKRLLALPNEGIATCDCRALFERLSLAVGKKMEWSEDAARHRETWIGKKTSEYTLSHTSTLIETVARTIDNYGVCILVEEDRLRVITFDEALAFWKGWLAEQEKDD